MAGARSLKFLAAGVLALAGAGGAVSADRPTARDESGGATLNFVATWFHQSVPVDPPEVDCPTGMAKVPDPSDYLKLTPIQLTAMREDRNKMRQWAATRGPGGADLCKQPWLEPNNTMPIGQSKNVNGLDLDRGKVNPGCGHADLVAHDGLTGVDNQYSRISACVEQKRMTGYLPTYMVGLMRAGEYTLLFQITGVDNLKNDDDIRILVTSSPDGLTKSTDGKTVVQHASFTPSEIPKYTHRFKGKIVDGAIVTTEKKDMLLPSNQHRRENLFRDAELRLHLQPDGTLKGALGAYLNLAEAFGTPGTGSESAAGPFSCTAYYNAIHALADGHPDPKTGKCTTISAGWDIEAAPAFITAPVQKTATPGRQAASGG